MPLGPKVAAVVLEADTSHLFWGSLSKPFPKAPRRRPLMFHWQGDGGHDLLLCLKEEEGTLDQWWLFY